MNIKEPEIQLIAEATICGCSTKQKSISYHFTESALRCYLDKSETILEQIQACERLLKYTKDDTEASVIKSEIIDLHLVLVKSWSNKDTEPKYCSSLECRNKAVIKCTICPNFYVCSYQHAYVHNHLIDEFEVLR